MRDEHTVICSPAVFELTSTEAPAVPVKVDLTYHSRDPYAVRASFRTGSSSVEWVFARDLLHGGLVGPAGLPALVLRRIHAAAIAALNSPELVENYNKVSGVPMPSSPEEYAVYLAQEQEKWGKVVKAIGFKAE